MKKLVVFSGAGMSAESDIHTFRDSDGLWENYKIEDVATPEAWQKDPELVQRFYNERRKNILNATPNSAHLAIAALEHQFDVNVITQNIDDLHERAGSSRVLHLHGNIRFAKTSGPDAQITQELYPIRGSELKLDRDYCKDGYPLRPHVVWFGESVSAYQDAIHQIRQADIFIVIGSTLSVYPVAGLIHEISGSCEAYYIDPKADYHRVPKQYQLLKMTASEGVKTLSETLKSK